jgi:hypothetical protein
VGVGDCVACVAETFHGSAGEIFAVLPDEQRAAGEDVLRSVLRWDTGDGGTAVFLRSP